MLRGGQESFAETTDPRTSRPIYFNVYKEGMSGAPQGTDIWATENGYVSVTPMKVGETDPAQVDALKGWFR
jgi:broad specificity polyphosphatase/5'/3'-nucleotidase SurE